MNAAAVSVPQNQDIFYLQVLDGVFNGGGGSVAVGKIAVISRNQVGNIANDKDVAGTGIQNNGRINAGIAACNDERMRCLPFFGKVFIGFRVFNIIFLIKLRGAFKLYRLLRCCSGLVIICKLMCVYNRSPHGYAVRNINFTERKLLS